ncbi:hypothetical protein MJN51_35615, partial [Salmonella enterica subsp. enterica serovar Kentucky]|nr:hypothetical protein [Salmonella enterica subsp. enterica serovar Kentucky]
MDWTHEREWRWPYRGDIKNFLNHIKEYGIPENIESTPGFDFTPLEAWATATLAQHRAYLAQQQNPPFAMPVWHYLTLHQPDKTR